MDMEGGGGSAMIKRKERTRLNLLGLLVSNRRMLENVLVQVQDDKALPWVALSAASASELIQDPPTGAQRRADHPQSTRSSSLHQMY